MRYILAVLLALTIATGVAFGAGGETVTYKVKIGSGALSGSLTAAQVQALGNQVTDNGNIQLYIELAGGTSNSTVQDSTLTVDYTYPGTLGAYVGAAYSTPYEQGAWR